MPALESDSMWSGGRFPEFEDWLVFKAEESLGLAPLVIVPVWDRRSLLALCRSADTLRTEAEGVRCKSVVARLPLQ